MADNALIVIAEDEVASRALLKRQLERAGYQVVACENGREALTAVVARGANLLIADWMMPEMDGIELCRAVRAAQSGSETGFVYVLLLTAHSATEQIVAGLEAGADDYLTKPYHAQELLARVRAGERILRLQSELRDRNRQLQSINAEVSELNRRLEILANTDGLTGVWNRRAFFERATESWAFAQRTGQPLSAVMLDVDRFKAVNDTYGHGTGDTVLKEVAEACRATIRPYDVLGRLGGEEFCILAPNCGAEGAAALAERVRAAIERVEIRAGSVVLRVTASFGAAERRAAHDAPETLLAEADTMLYEAKRNGRNQVWISSGAAGVGQRYQPTPAGAIA